MVNRLSAGPVRAVAGLSALVLVVGLGVWGVRSHGASPDAERQQGQKVVSLGRTAPVALKTMHDCSDLLDYYRREAGKIVGPFGLGPNPMFLYPGAMKRGDFRASSEAAVPALASSGQSTEPDSSTNVQVTGVDESDVMKTSADLLVSVVDGAVRITRLAGQRTATLATWRPVDASAQGVLLDQGAATTTAVILETNNFNDWPGIVRGPSPVKIAGPFGLGYGATRLTVLDLNDPAHPRPVRRLEITGNLSGNARLVDGELRLAVTSDATGLVWKQPRYRFGTSTLAQSRAAEKRSTAANRRLIATSTIDNWLPRATVTELNAAGKAVGPPVRRPLLDCSKVAVPEVFSGVQTLAMVSVDLRTSSPLSAWRAAGVVASGTTLYANADHAWLATSRWDRPMPVEGGGPASAAIAFAPVTDSTQVHLFDTPLRAEPRYVASGPVDGTLLNEFAMDERGGLLRVASTTAGITRTATTSRSVATAPEAKPGSGAKPGPEGKPGPLKDQIRIKDAATAAPSPTAKLSQGRVTVLKVDGDRLVQAGLITGLGLGEQIRAVRFVDTIGYVVTYRQTDPLYTIDLSDPTHPRLRGELKITGYSAYLHPSGPGRVLGLGRDGGENDQIGSLQLSLFDVGNLDAPQRLAQQRMPGAWTDAESDHHAFTMTGDLVLIPFTSSTPLKRPAHDPGQVFDAGVMAARVTGDSIGSPVILRPIATGPVTLNMAAESVKRASRAQIKVAKVLAASPLRVAVHDGLIYTLTRTGIAVHNSTDFSKVTFDPF